MNVLLHERNLNTLTLQRYREVFTFPVKDYYKEIGIDFSKDPFSDIGLRFMELYLQNVNSLPLVSEAVDTLKFFEQQHFQQFILSAMEQDALQSSVSQRKIHQYFKHIYGIDNHYGGGKAALAENLLATYHLDRENTWLIGDTLHDLEVANLIGCRCILVSYGHQSKERLEKSNATVYKTLTEVKEHFSEANH